MRRRTLIAKNLLTNWRMHATLGLGVAVACAILAGSLIVGDSVRETLGSLARERLGNFQLALSVDRFFGADLGREIAGSGAYPDGAGEPVAVLLLGASASKDVDGEVVARAGRVSVAGIDESFARIGFPSWSPGGAPGPGDRADATGVLRTPGPGTVILNRTLAGELDAAPGDVVLVSLTRASDAPLESLLGKKDARQRRLRLQVASVVPDRGPGLFSLRLAQSSPRIAFVNREELARAIGAEGQANVLLSPGAGDSGPLASAPFAAALREKIRMSDLGLVLRRSDSLGYLTLETGRMIIEPVIQKTVESAARNLQMRTSPVLTNLARTIALVGEGGEVLHEIPYSTVAVMDAGAAPPFGPLKLVGGRDAPTLSEDQLLINSWVAEDFGLDPEKAEGAAVRIEYYLTDSEAQDRTAGEKGLTSEANFTVVGVVPLEGVAADPHLTPEFPGITTADVKNMKDWDPPFEIDKSRIRVPRDEDYWDRYRATPKAFVSADVGENCFQSRFGSATSIRIAPAAGQTLAGATGRFERELLRVSDLPATLGFSWRDVRSEALQASSGSTDFGMLFVSFSFFLIVAAAMLVALLFGLQVDRRSREAGLYLALGCDSRWVRRVFLAEAVIVAGLGGLVGLAVARAYGRLLLHGLRTWWWAAVRVPYLEFAASATNQLIGWVVAEIVVLVAIFVALRRLRHLPIRGLLAGLPPSSASMAGRARRSSRRSLLVAVATTILAVVLAAVSATTDLLPLVGAFFGVGACVLVAGLAFLSAWLGRVAPRRETRGRLSLLSVGARNASRAPGRSILTASLVAAATFILVAVAANRHDARADRIQRDSGNGGFALLGTTEAPFVRDLNLAEVRDDLGLEEVELRDPGGGSMTVDWSGVKFQACRVRDGDDASCLNLYAPQNPRVLGVSEEFVNRGGFRFKGQVAGSELERENPWRLLRRTFEDGAVPAIGDWNSTTWILKKGLGEDIVIEKDDRGEELRLRLVATLDRSIFQGELLIGEEAFRDRFPDHEGYRALLVEIPPGGEDERRTSALERALESRMQPAMDVERTTGRLASFLRVENSYLSTFQLLGGLGLLLGTFGLAVVLIRGVLERRRELALLRAVGFPGRRLAALVIAENALLLVGGVLIGTAAAMLAVLPQLLEPGAAVDWAALGALLGVVVLTGLLAGGLAALVAVRSPLLPVLKRDD